MSEALLVNLDEVSAILGGISRRSVQQLIFDGSLPSVKLGRRRLVAVSALDAFVRRLQADNGSELEEARLSVVGGGSGVRRRT